MNFRFYRFLYNTVINNKFSKNFEHFKAYFSIWEHFVPNCSQRYSIWPAALGLIKKVNQNPSPQNPFNSCCCIFGKSLKVFKNNFLPRFLKYLFENYRIPLTRLAKWRNRIFPRKWAKIKIMKTESEWKLQSIHDPIRFLSVKASLLIYKKDLGLM